MWLPWVTPMWYHPLPIQPPTHAHTRGQLVMVQVLGAWESQLELPVLGCDLTSPAIVGFGE